MSTPTGIHPVFSEPATLVGHRGLGKGVVDGHLENTLSSFLGALDAGLDWVEVDVRRTLDDQLFVAHDAFAGSTFLTRMTATEASRAGGLRIDELLEALPSSAGVAFDLKSSLEDAGRPSASTTAALLAQAGKRMPWRRPVVALSFDPASLRHMREELPTLPLGLLTWFRFPVGHAVAAAAHLDVQVLAIHAGSLWPSAVTTSNDIPSPDEVVQRVHDVDRELMVWCPNRAQARVLVSTGVDALVVDDVPRHVRARSRMLVGRALDEANSPREAPTEPRP